MKDISQIWKSSQVKYRFSARFTDLKNDDSEGERARHGWCALAPWFLEILRNVLVRTGDDAVLVNDRKVVFVQMTRYAEAVWDERSRLRQ